jgi:hypothetical protein
MILAHLAALGAALVQGQQHLHPRPRVASEVVPLVRAVIREVGLGRVIGEAGLEAVIREVGVERLQEALRQHEAQGKKKRPPRRPRA